MIEIETKVNIPLKDGGHAVFVAFSGLDKDHFAVLLGEYEEKNGPINVRIHSECVTGDVFSSRRCDCGDQLQHTIKIFNHMGGVLIYLRQEGRGIGFNKKMAAYFLQDQGLDTFEANVKLGHLEDEREYSDAVHMLKRLGVKEVRLHTNNPQKIEALMKEGIIVQEVAPTPTFRYPENQAYLRAKKNAGHSLE